MPCWESELYIKVIIIVLLEEINKKIDSTSRISFVLVSFKIGAALAAQLIMKDSSCNFRSVVTCCYGTSCTNSRNRRTNIHYVHAMVRLMKTIIT
jgi:hypothetical protein